MSLQDEVNSDITEINDSNTKSLYEAVSSTTDDLILQSKGNIKLLFIIYSSIYF